MAQWSLCGFMEFQDRERQVSFLLHPGIPWSQLRLDSGWLLLTLPVLCSTIIDHIQTVCKREIESKPVCVYYYFDFNDRKKQTLDGFVRSVLVQLSRHREIIPREVQELCDDKGKQQLEPTTDKLTDTLFALLKQFAKIYIIIDALDECREQSEMFDLMSKMMTPSGWSTNLLITSRRERQIEIGLQPLLTRTVSVRGPEVSRDIQTLVRRVLMHDPKLKKRPLALKEEI